MPLIHRFIVGDFRLPSTLTRPARGVGGGWHGRRKRHGRGWGYVAASGPAIDSAYLLALAATPRLQLEEATPIPKAYPYTE